MTKRLALLALSLPILIGAAPVAPPPIADLWFAHNAMTMMLGAAGSIRVTVDTPTAQPWMFRVAPELRRAQIVANGSANAETLLGQGVKLAFTAQAPEAARLKALGIDARDMSFSDVPGMARSLRETASAIGTPLARQRLRDYEAYTAAVLRRLGASVGSLPEARKPRVLHLVSWSPLKADGANTMIDTWIRAAGGRNAADGLIGNQKPISIEQIAQWNPDIIIVGGPAKGPDDQPWIGIPAMAGRRVVRNPAGVFPWDRYGPEFALQLQWAAKLFHPGEAGTGDMAAETQRFYRRFYGYHLTDAEAHRILASLPPAP
ncbi:ABC transporter substrate-binding protein [Sphingomonas nostoxanthinifaciens]|uniref:ABC transporter substrate-binding protein n=1 Tax=Sphingomonas nostoxanthinifaciens TaxID=2872652 RepID=UPI001CC1F05B|nr:ABC transporter substrate-binding protein [Sphingomonas nostoxanthinifaciens]UAK25817.1 ABC transporter substrate-binding protein [Sphingomonas nostoxanthinifaciens]